MAKLSGKATRISVLLSAPVEVLEQRRASRGSPPIPAHRLEAQARSVEALACSTYRQVVVDASRPASEVLSEVRAALWLQLVNLDFGGRLHQALLELLAAHRQELQAIPADPSHLVLVTAAGLEVVKRKRVHLPALARELARFPADQVPVVVVAEVREREHGWHRVELVQELATLDRARRIVR